MKRTMKVETVIRVPLKSCHSDNPRHERYQLRRRGKIARLLKPKPKRSEK